MRHASSRGAEHGHRQPGVEHELRAPEGVRLHLAIRLVGIEHQHVDARQRLARAAVPDHANRDAVGHWRPRRGQDDRQLPLADQLEDRRFAGQSERLVLNDADALAAPFDEICRPPAPGTSPTGHWPSRDASSSLRVNWLVRRSSVVMELHNPPGEYSSSPSSDAHLLEVVDCRSHSCSVPCRPVVGRRQPRYATVASYSGASSFAGLTCSTSRSREPLRPSGIEPLSPGPDGWQRPRERPCRPARQAAR